MLVLHVLALWLLAWGSLRRTGPPPPEPQFVSFWVEPPKALPPPSPPPVAPRVARKARSSSAPASPVPAPVSPEPIAEPRTAPAPSIDWSREAAAVADAHVKPPADPGFGGKPLPQPRERCKVKEWQWTPEPKKGGVLPLPYVVLGRCVVGLGFFGCAVGEKPETNTHQLDAYKRGEKTGPSVPDPNTCDE